jgi:tRNA A-37 threonylcarbamoyl transferase component Bud32
MATLSSLFQRAVEKREIRGIQRRAQSLIERAGAVRADDSSTLWSTWPVNTTTRERIEAYRDQRGGEAILIGKVDTDGRVFGVFGDLPGMENISAAEFVSRHRFPLDLVLLDDKVLARKDFRGDRVRFLREWHNLALLQGRANVPSLYRVDEDGGRLYRNLINGRTIREVLVEAGARILNVQTENDPELVGLDRRSRLEAILARGTALLVSQFSEKFLQEIAKQMEMIHACGVVGLSLTFGNIVVDSQRGAPWFIDLEGARAYRSTWNPLFVYRRSQDRVKYHKIYGRVLKTENSPWTPPLTGESRTSEAKGTAHKVFSEQRDIRCSG